MPAKHCCAHVCLHRRSWCISVSFPCSSFGLGLREGWDDLDIVEALDVAHHLHVKRKRQERRKTEMAETLQQLQKPTAQRCRSGHGTYIMRCLSPIDSLRAPAPPARTHQHMLTTDARASFGLRGFSAASFTGERGGSFRSCTENGSTWTAVCFCRCFS